MIRTTTSRPDRGMAEVQASRGRRWPAAVVLTATVASLVWLAPLLAQAPPAEAVGAEQGPAETPQPGTQEEPVTPQEQAALELVERILAQDDRLLSGEFSYDSGGRRDPFRSLLQPSGTQAVAPPSTRPQGLAGLLVQEVQVTGIARYLGGWHAVLTASDGQTHFARVGAQLYDGRIVEIRPEEVVFEREVEDVLGNRRVRQVVKRLRTE